MTIIPTIVSGLLSVFLWLHFRKSFKRHIIDVFAISVQWKYFFDFLTIFSFSTRFLLRFENSFLKGPWFNVLVTGSYVLLGFMGLFTLMLLVFDIEILVSWIKKKIINTTEFEVESNSHSRRSFLKRNLTIASLAGGGLVTGVGLASSFDPKVKPVVIELKSHHAGIKGLKVVQLSDIHIGPSLKSAFSQLLVDRVNALKPDVIVITGDMVDGRVSEIGEDLKPFKDFQSTHGTFFVTGNHEFYWYSREWTDYAKELGMKVLNNENVQLTHNGTPFYLAGVSDLASRKHDPENACDMIKAKNAIPDEAFKILLSHQPKTCFEACKLNYDVQLSGHTHGGQGFPWNIIVHLVQPYVKGLHDVEGMKLYVSSGTGFWGPPNRFMVDSEITEIIFS